MRIIFVAAILALLMLEATLAAPNPNPIDNAEKDQEAESEMPPVEETPGSDRATEEGSPPPPLPPMEPGKPPLTPPPMPKSQRAIEQEKLTPKPAEPKENKDPDYEMIKDILDKEMEEKKDDKEELKEEVKEEKKKKNVGENDMVEEMLTAVQKQLGPLDKEGDKKPVDIDGEVTGSDLHVPMSYRLKWVRSFMTPDLLKALASTDHGDTILLASNDFPANTVAGKAGKTLIRIGGVSIPDLLKSIMNLVSVCTMDEYPLMVVNPESSEAEDEEKLDKIWTMYRTIVEEAEERTFKWAKLSQENFEQEAEKAAVIVQTGDENPMGSMILTKGHIPDEDELMRRERKKMLEAIKPEEEVETKEVKEETAKDKASRILAGENREREPTLDELKRTLAMLQAGEEEEE